MSVNGRLDTQIKGTEQSPETDSYKYDQLLSSKGTNTVQRRKMVFSPSGAGTIRHPCANNHNQNLDWYLTPSTKLK